MATNVFITGITSFIGHYLYLAKPPDIELTGSVRDKQRFHFQANASVQLHHSDLTEPLAPQLSNLKPDVLIHCAAIAGMGACEQNPQQAYNINAKATEQLARWCRQRDVRLIYLSTDIVFGGDHPPYDEDDNPTPINAYGTTKREGEKAVQDQLQNHAIARIALSLGRGIGHTRNFLDWFMERLNRNETIPLFKDEVRTPTAIRPLVSWLWKLALSSETGIFHLCGLQSLNRLQLGEKICQNLGRGHDLLRAVSMHEAAPNLRPSDVSLVSSRTVDSRPLQINAIELYLPYLLA